MPEEPVEGISRSVLRRIFENHYIAWGVAVIAILAAVAQSAAETAGETDTAASEEATPSPSPSPTEDPPPVPSPDAEYTGTCDYVLGDFTDKTATGYRFIAGADIENTGNIGVEVEVVAEWKQLGTKPLRAKETVKIPVGGAESVQITRRGTGDQISLHQSAQDAGGEPCSVDVALADTYGDPDS